VQFGPLIQVQFENWRFPLDRTLVLDLVQV